MPNSEKVERQSDKMNTASNVARGSPAIGRTARTWMTAAVSLALALTSSAQDLAPQSQLKMTKIVCRYFGPQIAPGSPDAQVNTIYRAGDKYDRLEQSSDPAQKTGMLQITSEPDAWSVNLTDQTAVHMLDKGPDFSVHRYIIWSQPSRLPDAAFLDLEFGKEAIFVRQAQVKEIGMRKIGNTEAKAFLAKGGDRNVTLFFDPVTDKPLRIVVTKNGKPDMAVEYLEYETGLPFDPALFELPKGIKITEQK